MLTWLAAISLMAWTGLSAAQVTTELGNLGVAIEGYANLSVGDAHGAAPDNQVRLDAAGRFLARWKNASGPDVGLRAVLESSPEAGVDLAEVSLLVFGSAGRFEVGERQGLPDVLLGYAPNNFTFTGAEFGPASGPSLDPGGGLQAAFFGKEISSTLSDLTGLGFTAALADDRSSKALYVSPKWHGWLVGASYAPQATDPRFEDLAQFGATHDHYWAENQLHVGGSASLANTAPGSGPNRYLVSVNLGATLVLDYEWMLGLSATYESAGGTRTPAEPVVLEVEGGWGTIASVNYNHGPWTFGAFAQRAERYAEAPGERASTLTALEAGASYRLTTKLRAYASWYAFDINPARGTGQLLLVGVRATL